MEQEGRKALERWPVGLQLCLVSAFSPLPFCPLLWDPFLHWDQEKDPELSWSWARVLTLLPDQQSPDDAPKLRVGIRMVLQMSLVGSLACPPSASGLCRLNLKFILGSRLF